MVRRLHQRHERHERPDHRDDVDCQGRDLAESTSRRDEARASALECVDRVEQPCPRIVRTPFEVFFTVVFFGGRHAMWSFRSAMSRAMRRRVPGRNRFGKRAYATAKPDPAAIPSRPAAQKSATTREPPTATT